MRRSYLTLALAALLGSLVWASTAQAYDLRGFAAGLNDPGTKAGPTPGAPQLAAGAHPDVTIRPLFEGARDANGVFTATESIRNVDVALPRGVILNPTAAPRCTQQQLSQQVAQCPIASQIGQVFIEVNGNEQDPAPIYNMVPPSGVPAQVAFNYLRAVVRFNGKVRSGGDYGISAEARDLTQALPLTGARIELWGVPADSVHDDRRNTVDQDGNFITGPAGVAPRPFVSNPGRCTGAPLTFTASGNSWQDPVAGPALSAYTQRVGGEPLTITGCESLPFEPSVSVKPSTTKPDSPTGVDVDVNVPQTDSPGERSSAHLKDLSLLLPDGMNVNPSAADGLSACAPSEIALSSSSPAACPASSSIGRVSIDTPLLDAPLTGRAYLAKQGDNPFGSTLALYLAAKGSGVVIKLAGRIDPDPSTGRVRVTFSDNPELPFSRLRVSLDDGPRAALTTPPSCGAHVATGTATPWSGGAAVPVSSAFSIDCSAGLGGFAPVFSAGTKSPSAGVSSPLLVNVSREDGQQSFNGLSLSFPTGLLAKLRGVRQCADAQVRAGTCDAQSRVGGVTVTAGAGPTPFPLGGDAYLTGPYKGAPSGLVVKVRAVAGPLDLGAVNVRQALFIDPLTTQVRAVSDPLPTILSGIPIRLRSLRVNVDRPGFPLNPTSCARKSFAGVVGAPSGARANVASPFQVGSCGALEFKPKLALRLGGKGSALRDGGHPSLKAILTQGGGQSNLKRAEVKLPLSLALDPDNAQTLCEFADGQKAAPTCPKGSVVGTAKVRTPLLNRTLSGPVYFVKGQRTDKRTGRVIRTLPTLVVSVQGEGVRITLRAKTAVSRGRLVTTFDPIPDAPVSRFDLAINGGRNGILVANSSVCSKSRTLGVGIRGQNGALARSSPALAATCR